MGKKSSGNRHFQTVLFFVNREVARLWYRLNSTSFHLILRVSLNHKVNTDVHVMAIVIVHLQSSHITNRSRLLQLPISHPSSPSSTWHQWSFKKTLTCNLREWRQSLQFQGEVFRRGSSLPLDRPSPDKATHQTLCRKYQTPVFRLFSGVTYH